MSKKLVIWFLAAVMLAAPIIASADAISNQPVLQVTHKAPVIGHHDPALLDQADAGFLEQFGSGEWYCKKPDGSIWVLIPDGVAAPDPSGYADAVAWCEANGYRW